MADTKLTALSAIGTLGDDDIFYVVDDPGGTPLSRKVTAANLAAYTTPAASDTVAGKIEIAVQSEMETGTSTTLAVVPGRQQFHPGHPKYWQRSTVSGGTPTLSVSYNVTSITDTALGRLTVTIATDFSGAAWCNVPGGTGPAGAGITSVLNSSTTMAAGSIELWADAHTDSIIVADPVEWHSAGYGDQ
jgi:hypothetical protein